MGGLKSIVSQSFKGLFTDVGTSSGASFVGPPSSDGSGFLGGLMGKFNKAKDWVSKGVDEGYELHSHRRAAADGVCRSAHERDRRS